MNTPPMAHVLIPTTEGLAEILGISRLDARLGRSTMTLGARFAGKDRAYDAFVRGPEGVVARLVGHSSFRLRVGMDFTTGSSWQLPVLIAHMLERRGRLASRDTDDGADILIWATGRVSPTDLSVGDVGHVGRKVATSLPLLRNAAEKGARLYLFLPQDNASDIAPGDARELAALGTTVIPVANCSEALFLLGCEPETPIASGTHDPNRRTGNPYPGLYPFSEDMRDVFFGRGRAREETLEQLQASAASGTPFLVIHGRSGAGKSSLAISGLTGDVVEQVSQGGRWTIAVARIGSEDADVRDLVAAAIADALCLKGDRKSAFIARFRSHPVDAVTDHISSRATFLDPATLFLIIDQFEQADVGSAESGSLAALGDALEQLVASGCAWVVITIRTDRLDMLERSDALSRLSASERSYRLTTPTLSELREIIARPAIAAGFVFGGDDIVDHLAEVAMRSPDSLPLLQFVLHRMVEVAGNDRTLDLSTLDRLGGFDGALGRYAEQVFDAIAEPEQAKHDVLAGLLRVDPSGDTVIPRPLDTGGLMESGREAAIIRRLTDARLLASHHRNGGAGVHIAHEALIRAWPRLKRVADDKIDLLRRRDALEHAARQWSLDGHDDDLLLRGADRIESAETVVAGIGGDIADTIAPFVRASRLRHDKAEEAARRELEEKLASSARQIKLSRRLWRRTLAGGVVTLVLAGTAFFFARQAGSTLDLAKSSEALGLARLASDKAAADGIEATMLALAALEAEPRGDAESIRIARETLQRSVTDTRTHSLLVGHAGQINAAIVSADGHYALTASSDRRAIVWDAATGRQRATLQHPDPVKAAVFTASGGRAVTASQYGNIRIWDISSPAKPLSDFRITAANDEMFARYLAFEARMLDAINLTHPGEIDGLSAEEYAKKRQLIEQAIEEAGPEAFAPELMASISVGALALSANGVYALVASESGEAAVWRVEDGSRINSLPRRPDGQEYRFSPDGRSVVAGSDNHPLPQPDPPARPGGMSTIGFDPSLPAHMQEPSDADAPFSAVVMPDRSVHIVERLPALDTFDRVRIAGLAEEESLLALGDGVYLAGTSPSKGDVLVLRDSETGEELSRLDLTPRDLFDMPQFVDGGTRLLLPVGGSGGSLHIVELRSHDSKWTASTTETEFDPALQASGRPLLSDGGRFVVAARRTNSAAGVELEIAPTDAPGRKSRRFTLPDRSDMRIIGLSHDGEILAVAGSSQSVELHNLVTGHRIEIGDKSPLLSEPKRVRFMKDADMVVLVRHAEVSLHDGSNGRILARAHMATGVKDTFIGNGSVAIVTWQEDILSWSPAVMSQPLVQLACERLPRIDGLKYWSAEVEDRYGAAKLVERICDSRE